MAVKIVTDSTSDLPESLVQELGITIVPLTVSFGEESFYDGVDLKADEFYAKLVSSPVLPTTSQPIPAAFTRVYDEFSGESDEILSIHISAKLSGTHNSAVLAREDSKSSSRIVVIDSQMASMGLGMIVIKAAKAAQSGASLDEVVQITQDAMSKVSFFGMVDTLEYLQKGGRIGKAQALMGTLLSIKPIIGCVDGEVHPQAKARTRKKAMGKLLEMVQEYKNIDGVTVMNSTVPDEAAAFTEKITAFCERDKIIQARIGPVIGTYLGPGSVAIGVMTG